MPDNKWTPPATDQVVQDNGWTPPTTDQLVEDPEKKNSGLDGSPTGGPVGKLTPSAPKARISTSVLEGFTDVPFLQRKKKEAAAPQMLTAEAQKAYKPGQFSPAPGDIPAPQKTGLSKAISDDDDETADAMDWSFRGIVKKTGKKLTNQVAVNEDEDRGMTVQLGNWLGDKANAFVSGIGTRIAGTYEAATDAAIGMNIGDLMGGVAGGGTLGNAIQSLKGEPDKNGKRHMFTKDQVDSTVKTIRSIFGDGLAGEYFGDYAKVLMDPDRQKEMQKHVRERDAPAIKKFFKETLKIPINAKQEKAMHENFVDQALYGVAQSVPAMVYNFGGSGMFFQAYDGGLEMVNSSEAGKSLDEDTKTIYAGSVGLVTSALEKLGLEKVLKSTKLFRGASESIVLNTIRDLSERTGGRITGDLLEQSLEKEGRLFMNRMAHTGFAALESFLIEGATGTAQETVQVGSEYLLNKVTGKPVFDTEDATWEGFGNNVVRIAKSGIQEGIGGVAMGGTLALFRRPRTKDYVMSKIGEAKSEEDLLDLKQEVRSMAASEQLDNKQIGSVLSTIDNLYKVKNSIPSELTAEEKATSIDLLAQKQDLQDTYKYHGALLATLDPSFADNTKGHMENLLTRQNSIDDNLREINTGMKYEFFEKDGKYFKRLGRGKGGIVDGDTARPLNSTNEAEEITHSRFSLENQIRFDEAQAQSEKKIAVPEEYADLVQDPAKMQDIRIRAKDLSEKIVAAEEAIQTVEPEYQAAAKAHYDSLVEQMDANDSQYTLEAAKEKSELFTNKLKLAESGDIKAQKYLEKLGIDKYKKPAKAPAQQALVAPSLPTPDDIVIEPVQPITEPAEAVIEPDPVDPVLPDSFEESQDERVDYNGIQGVLEQTQNGYQVIDDKGEAHPIESSLSGKSPAELGLTRIAAPEPVSTPEPVQRFTFDGLTSKIKIDGKEYIYQGVEENKTGQTTSLRVTDEAGKTKFIRNEEAILEIEIQKELFELQNAGELTAENIQDVANELGLTEVENETGSLETVTEVQPVGSAENTTEVESKTETREIKGVENVFEEFPKLTEIGTLKEYLEYLNTVFPGSQLGDIAYHGTDSDMFESFNKSKIGSAMDTGTTGSGFYFTREKGRYSSRVKNNLSVLLNVQNPLTTLRNTIYDFGDRVSENDRWTDRIKVTVTPDQIKDPFLKKVAEKINGRKEVTAQELSAYFTEAAKEMGYDSVIGENSTFGGEEEIVIFDSEQIHILGSGLDQKKFKEWKENEAVKESKLPPAELKDTPGYAENVNSDPATILLSPQTPEEKVEGYKSRRKKVLANPPRDFREAVLQYFLSGSSLSTEDFIRYTGFGYVTNSKGKIVTSPELKQAKINRHVAARPKIGISSMDKIQGGTDADMILLYSIPEIFQKDGIDLIGEIVQVALSMDKADIVNELETYAVKIENKEMSTAELGRLDELIKEDAAAKAIEADALQFLEDEHLDFISSDGSEFYQTVFDEINSLTLSDDEIFSILDLAEKFMNPDETIDWEKFEAAYAESLTGFDADFLDVPDSFTLTKLFEYGAAAKEQINEIYPSTNSESESAVIEPGSQAQTKTEPAARTEPDTDEQKLNKEISAAEKVVKAAEQNVKVLEAKYAKLVEKLTKNLQANQQGIFENQTQSMFGDSGQSEIVSKTKAELDSARRDSVIAKAKLLALQDSRNQTELFKEKNSIIDRIFDTESVKPVVSFLESLKIKNKGVNSFILPIAPIYNGAINLMIIAVKSGNSLRNALEIAKEFLADSGSTAEEINGFEQSVLQDMSEAENSTPPPPLPPPPGGRTLEGDIDNLLNNAGRIEGKTILRQSIETHMKWDPTYRPDIKSYERNQINMSLMQQNMQNLLNFAFETLGYEGAPQILMAKLEDPNWPQENKHLLMTELMARMQGNKPVMAKLRNMRKEMGTMASMNLISLRDWLREAEEEAKANVRYLLSKTKAGDAVNDMEDLLEKLATDLTVSPEDVSDVESKTIKELQEELEAVKTENERLQKEVEKKVRERKAAQSKKQKQKPEENEYKGKSEFYKNTMSERIKNNTNSALDDIIKKINEVAKKCQ